MHLRVPSTVILVSSLVFGASSSARAVEPDRDPSSPSALDDEGDAPTSTASDEPSSEASPADDEPSSEASPADDEASSAATEDAEPGPSATPPPKVYDYDTPDLEHREKYPSVAPTELSVRDANRARAGGLLAGLGITAAVVAPIIVLRPRTPITVDTGDGTSLALDADAGPIVTGAFVSVVGGVSGVIGGRLLSDLGGDPSRAPGRRRALVVASGVAFGVASGLLVAGVVDLARGGVLWSDVLEREMASEDIADGEEAGRRLSRGVAMLTVVPPMAGLGLGLSLGGDARVRVLPSRNGLAMVGRF